MNTFEIKHKGNSLGIHVTRMNENDINMLFKLFIKKHNPDIENFVDWLIEGEYDNESYRILIDDVIDC